MSLVEDVRRLSREQLLAGAASIALFVTMLLPWYDKSFFQRGQVPAGSAWNPCTPFQRRYA